MTVTDQIKILNRKIMQNEAQQTVEDLGYKPSTVEQVKFDYPPLGKVFTKRLNKDDQGEELLKRLKNIENTQKNIINRDNNKSIYYIPRLQFDSEHDKDEDKKQQNNNTDTKSISVFNYLKSLSQEAEDLMDEIMQADADKDINIYKLVFIGSNRQKI